MKVTTKRIWVEQESYMFLNRICREQRGCKPLSNESEDRMWKHIMKSFDAKDGMYGLEDASLGGGDGRYNGRWWSWSVDTMIKMLDEANMPYTDGGIIEYDCCTI